MRITPSDPRIDAAFRFVISSGNNLGFIPPSEIASSVHHKAVHHEPLRGEFGTYYCVDVRPTTTRKARLAPLMAQEMVHQTAMDGSLVEPHDPSRACLCFFAWRISKGARASKLQVASYAARWDELHAQSFIPSATT